MKAKQSWVHSAARNNAEWCAAMCRSHGVGSAFGPESWWAPERTPLYYPDAVTLVPGADKKDLLERIDTGVPGACVKDSFADLDLASDGFRVLFEAQWIFRPASAPASVAGLVWDVVREPEALRAWALAWDGGNGHADLFRPELLDDPETFVLAGRRDGQVVSGAVASRSAEVVGLSNVFALEGEDDAAWPVALDAVHQMFTGLPVVGYEHGEDLRSALGHGFETIGSLRIWQHS